MGQILESSLVCSTHPIIDASAPMVRGEGPLTAQRVRR